ncbi:hypothetical protein OPS25_10655 [Alteromonas ponticola]|uniref:NfeD family protein n=1 Tax=Alteromonas aquimaris TaxID=2998417 RepID=A0ABT3P849_9ALTE|nr:NfeD family protein [Alteromonas aquimaris]MCW8108953.1 hypothetical protein [Alteromonas aquimaris]
MLGELPQSAPAIAMLLGLGLILVDVLILGGGTIILTVAGITFLVMSGLLYTNVIQSWDVALLVFAVLVGGLSLILWKPLKNFTKNTSKKKTKTDYHGIRFDLPEDLRKGQHVPYSYSGITWQVYSDTEITAGSTVKVVDVSVGKWFVKPI